MEIISNKNYNYPFAVIVWIVLFLIIFFLLKLVGFEGKFWTATALVLGGLIALADIGRIPIMHSKQLLLLGVQTGVWLDEGFYFLFFVFTLDDTEEQSVENKDVIVPVFPCQDKDGKVLNAEANGDYQIINHDAYKLHDVNVMLTNLTSLIRRTMVRVCGTIVYKTDILGKDLGHRILADHIFIRECAQYGIKFGNVIADAIASDLTQEGINAYAKELMVQFKSEYPQGHVFTHKELSDLYDKIAVQLKTAQRIITNSPTFVRTNV
jgi:hypothetical protein